MNVMVMQHDMNFMNMDSGSGSVMCLRTVNQLLDIKEEEQDPVLITFPVMKVEIEVSCVRV